MSEANKSTSHVAPGVWSGCPPGSRRPCIPRDGWGQVLGAEIWAAPWDEPRPTELPGWMCVFDVGATSHCAAEPLKGAEDSWVPPFYFIPLV